MQEITIKFSLLFLLSDEPDSPNAPKIEGMDRTSGELSWDTPANDGGSPVTGYFVEYRPTDSKDWQRANSFPVRDTRYTVPNLREGKEYQFRVVAENDAGEGKPSRASEPRVAKEPVCKYENQTMLNSQFQITILF